MKTRYTGSFLFFLGVILYLAGSAPPAAQAGIDVDFGAAVRVGDDSSIYFAVSSHYFDRDEESVRRWYRRCDEPDDLAVALFIAGHGHGSPDEVFALRGEGLSWWEIGMRVGVPADSWFPPVRRDPGPPYGKAYGHWKNHRKSRTAKLVLSDADARNLVAVRLLHEYYGVSVEAAMEWRASSRNLDRLTAQEYRNRHGKAKNKTATAGMGPSIGHGENYKNGKKSK